jgi:hypothetical protein
MKQLGINPDEIIDEGEDNHIHFVNKNSLLTNKCRLARSTNISKKLVVDGSISSMDMGAYMQLQ